MNDISFVHGVMKICPWCYEDMSLVLPDKPAYPENTFLFVCGVTVNGVTIKIV
jgi:hypothetical protein